MLEVLYHHAKFGGLGFHPPTVEFFFGCLFVCHAFERQSLCANFSMKALEYRNNFDIGEGLQLCMFNFLRSPPTGDSTKCQNPKSGKNLGFSPPEGDMINRLSQNLARKCIPWVCSGALNLALIGKGGGDRSPKCQNLPQTVRFLSLEGYTINGFK